MTYQEKAALLKQAKTIDEFQALAKENGIELSEESAKEYFAYIHKSGDVSDDELDNVSGGACDQSNPCKPITVEYDKPCFKCNYCYQVPSTSTNHFCSAEGERIGNNCRNCLFYRNHDEYANMGDFCKY